MGAAMTHMSAAQIKARIEADHAASFWLKKAIITAEGRDCLDALGDAEFLLTYCQQRAYEATHA